TAKAMIGFLANEKIEKIVINISVVAAPEITATVVDTQKLAITVPPRTDYSTDPLEFDLAQTLADLGIAAMSEIEAVVTYDTDESITDITATGNVFWYDLESNYGAWGANASVFVNYESTDLSYVSIGQYPDNVDSMLSYTYTVYYGFMANEKIEILEIAVTISDDTGLDQADEANEALMQIINPVRDELNIVFSKPVKPGYLSVYNINGAKVITKQVSGSETVRLNMKSITNGIYIVHFSDGSTVESVKFIKR
ncbi:T9SS type A sorting domain-containing protein, partial [Saccharicrinis sp. FJH62]|uniref:T9SS type A sorting domain-containing protein n=1 Tax=Saccharicrinis sp. FJH62 TaxID=3344657 RepID=UPI0035D42E9C